MQIILATPRGFCAGVDRAIDIVERALEIFGAPIYVRHEVVHNRYVVNDLRSKGAIFVEELAEVPTHSTVIFSAHGVSQAVRREADKRQLKVFDATCPLVTKVHLEVARHAKNNDEVILIGHAGHPEVEGTLGQYNSSSDGKIHLIETLDDIPHLSINKDRSLAYVTQTTLSVDDSTEIIQQLQRTFPHIQGPKKDDICYATQNRQDAVKHLATQCDLLLVVGSANSSNSNRLKELAITQGVNAQLIDGVEDIQASWLEGINKLGITAGASAPDILVNNVIQKIQAEYNAELIRDTGPEENIVFQLPRELRT